MTITDTKFSFPIQQINLTRISNRLKSAIIFFIIEQAKGSVLGFSKETVRVLWFYFVLILPWEGFLGVPFEGGRGKGKITPFCLKLVRINPRNLKFGT